MVHRLWTIGYEPLRFGIKLKKGLHWISWRKWMSFSCWTSRPKTRYYFAEILCWRTYTHPRGFLNALIGSKNTLRFFMLSAYCMSISDQTEINILTLIPRPQIAFLGFSVIFERLVFLNFELLSWYAGIDEQTILENLKA